MRSQYKRRGQETERGKKSAVHTVDKAQEEDWPDLGTSKGVEIAKPAKPPKLNPHLQKLMGNDFHQPNEAIKVQKRTQIQNPQSPPPKKHSEDDRQEPPKEDSTQSAIKKSPILASTTVQKPNSQEQKILTETILKYNKGKATVREIQLHISRLRPYIELKYKLNGVQHIKNILEVYQGAKQGHPKAIKLAMRLYGDNYKLLSREGCEAFFQILQFQKKFKGIEFLVDLKDSEKGGLTKVIANVFCEDSDGTIHFAFIDTKCAEIAFDSNYLEQHKMRFEKAYRQYKRMKYSVLAHPKHPLAADTPVKPRPAYKPKKVEEPPTQPTDTGFITLEVSTIVLSHIKQCYFESKSQNKEDWLAKSTMFFDLETNVLSLKKTEHAKDRLDQYIAASVKDISNQSIVHHYPGLNTAIIGDGGTVTLVHMDCSFKEVRIMGLTKEGENTVIEGGAVLCEYFDRIQKGIVFAFSSQSQVDVFLQMIGQLTDEGTLQQDVRIEVATALERKSILHPKTTISFRFWASATKTVKRLHLTYPTENRSLVDVAQDLAKHFPELFPRANPNMNEIQVSIKNTAISNEHEMDIALARLYKNIPSLLRHDRIVVGREICEEESIRSKEWWMERIHSLTRELKVGQIGYQSSCQDPNCPELKHKQKKGLKECNKHSTEIRISMTTTDWEEAEKLKVYDGRYELLGTEKTHVTVQHQQVIGRWPVEIFNYFQQQYRRRQHQLESKFQGLLLKETIVEVKSGQFVEVECISPVIKGLFLAVSTIRFVFLSWTIWLQPAQICNFAQRQKHLFNKYGKSTTDSIREKGGRELYVDYKPMSDRIILYGNKGKISEAKQTIMRELELISSRKVDRICYRYKKLKEIKEIVEAYRDTVIACISLPQRKVYYVEEQNNENMTAFKHALNRIERTELRMICAMCFEVPVRPIKLLNCQHRYCRGCLVDYISDVKQNPRSFPLMCPAECKSMISIVDLKDILDASAFEKVCDMAMKNFASGSGFHRCLTVGCEMIFLSKRTRNQQNFFSCPLCKHSYCRICEDTKHQFMSCQVFQQMKQQKSEKEMPLTEQASCVSLELKRPRPATVFYTSPRDSWTSSTTESTLNIVQWDIADGDQ